MGQVCPLEMLLPRFDHLMYIKEWQMKDNGNITEDEGESPKMRMNGIKESRHKVMASENADNWRTLLCF